MRQYFIRIFFFSLTLLLLSCGHNNRQYANMPPDLAKLSKAIDKHPKDAEARYARAVYYYNRGFIDEAKLDMFECLKLNDKTSKYYVLMSDIYFAEKETDETEEMLERAIALDPTNNEARLKLAELYFHLRMFAECNATLDAALEQWRREFRGADG